MKSVMLSVHPKWCELIANGEKTIDLRKSIPKLETPFKCYIYCTKPNKKFQTVCKSMVLSEDELYRHPQKGIKYGNSVEMMLCEPEEYSEHNFLNGKVIGEFTCDQTYQYSTENISGTNISDDEMTKRSCLTKAEIEAYEFSASYKDFEVYNIGVYGWNITDLKIYDQPKQLSDFTPYGYATKFGGKKKFKRPPQSWCYVEG